jgi:hypothetical protein
MDYYKSHNYGSMYNNGHTMENIDKLMLSVLYQNLNAFGLTCSGGL